MDTLLVVLLVSFAVAFTTELLSFLLGWVPFVGRFVGSVLTLPVAVGYHYILGTTYPDLVVNSAATAFLALAFGIIVDRVSNSQIEVRRGRRG